MIKLAMLAIHRRLKQEKSPARMLLQIHDELVFEAPESEIDGLAKLVRDEMQNVMSTSRSVESRCEIGPQLGRLRTVGGMKTIGVVGGVASGKSLVSQMLVELGAAVLDADRTGHAVLAEDAEVREALRERWGNAVLTPPVRSTAPPLPSMFSPKTNPVPTSGKFWKVYSIPEFAPGSTIFATNSPPRENPQ